MTESQIEEGKQASVLFLAMDLLLQSMISCVSILPLTAALSIASLPDPQYPPPSAVLPSHKGIPDPVPITIATVIPAEVDDPIVVVAQRKGFDNGTPSASGSRGNSVSSEMGRAVEVSPRPSSSMVQVVNVRQDTIYSLPWILRTISQAVEKVNKVDLPPYPP
jgi:hypothetical protein